MMLDLLRAWRESWRADARRRVLSTIAHGEVCGSEIARRSRIWTGALYPLLDEMETTGVLTSRWEIGRSGPGRPRRRLYKAVKPECGPWG